MTAAADDDVPTSAPDCRFLDTIDDKDSTESLDAQINVTLIKQYMPKLEESRARYTDMVTTGEAEGAAAAAQHIAEIQKDAAKELRATTKRIKVKQQKYDDDEFRNACTRRGESMWMTVAVADKKMQHLAVELTGAKEPVYLALALETDKGIETAIKVAWRRNKHRGIDGRFINTRKTMMLLGEGELVSEQARKDICYMATAEFCNILKKTMGPVKNQITKARKTLKESGSVQSRRILEERNEAVSETGIFKLALKTTTCRRKFDNKRCHGFKLLRNVYDPLIEAHATARTAITQLVNALYLVEYDQASQLQVAMRIPAAPEVDGPAIDPQPEP